MGLLNVKILTIGSRDAQPIPHSAFRIPHHALRIKKGLTTSFQHIMESRPAKVVHVLFHVAMLVLSLFLIISISIDTFHGELFYNQRHFVHIQTWICAFFILDYFVELLYAKHKWKYALKHLFFLLVSIPYLYIFYYFGLTFPSQVAYLLQFIPLVRGGYALAVVIGWFAYNRVASIFYTYIITLLGVVYFGSLVFYMFEYPANPDLSCYQDALYWACMDTVTVGSDIYAITSVGRIISVILAALGMMMFPIFTVYITSLIVLGRKRHPLLFTTPALLARLKGDDDDEDSKDNGETNNK